jgi:hypothetical protein
MSSQSCGLYVGCIEVPSTITRPKMLKTLMDGSLTHTGFEIKKIKRERK